MKRKLVTLSSLIACSLLCGVVGVASLQTETVSADGYYTVNVSGATLATANANDMQTLDDGTVQVKAGATVDVQADYVYALREDKANFSISGASFTNTYYTHKEFTMPSNEVTVTVTPSTDEANDYDYRELTLNNATVATGDTISLSRIEFADYGKANTGWFGATGIDFTKEGLTTITIVWDNVWETYGRTNPDAATNIHGYVLSSATEAFNVYDIGYEAMMASGGTNTATSWGKWNSGAYAGKGAVILDVASGKVTGRHGNQDATFSGSGYGAGIKSYADALAESSVFGMFFSGAYSYSSFVNLRAVDNLGNEYPMYFSTNESGETRAYQSTGAVKGGSVTLQAEEKAGYVVTGWNVTGATNVFEAGNEVSFTMPTAAGEGVVAEPVYEQVLSNLGVSVKTNGTQGLRFKAQINKEYFADYAEGEVKFGMEVTHESLGTADVALENWFDEEQGIYTAMLKFDGVTNPTDYYDDVFTAKAYYEIDGTRYYAAEQKASIAYVAKCAVEDTEASYSAEELAYLTEVAKYYKAE